jgi:transposase-like protein
VGIDSAFLTKENKLLNMDVKCSICGGKIGLFVNTISSAGEAWPFCQKCGTYVDVVPDS